MKLELRIHRLRAAVTTTLAVLALANIGLTISLVAGALGAKTVVVVPGARLGRNLPANVPSPEAVRDFAVLYLAHFDSYTPATIEEVTRYLEGWLSPRFFAQASEALKRRKELVSQSRMASQILLPNEEAAVHENERGEFAVTLVALRRTYIADKLQSENRLAYTIVIEAGTPTLRNPYGLYVTGQLIAPKDEGGERNAAK